MNKPFNGYCEVKWLSDDVSRSDAIYSKGFYINGFRIGYFEFFSYDGKRGLYRMGHDYKNPNELIVTETPIAQVIVDLFQKTV